ncbi:MAG: 50S ribosomal protein L15 [Dehalococcoidia bacterium]|nr:50S ribosomal protein L15 [Dehalococcoidia bacterium]MDW8119292.1 50S ribosomal protein L15 [Chloroflexota bacterium]
MQLHNLRPQPGARRPRRRIGRGTGSGRGDLSGRGRGGQKARSGKGPRPGFEGGQTPLILRLPHKRGFHNPFPKTYQIVHLGDLDARFSSGEEVTVERMVQAGLVRHPDRPVKVLADGDLTKPLRVVAHRFSATARQKVLSAGGQVEELEASPTPEA